MHKFLIGIASAAFLTAPALAADLPVKAQPAPEVFSWSGFYIAVAGGWRHNRVDWDYTNPIPASLSPFRNGNDTGSLAFISGAQRQFGFVVLGVESSTDISLGRGFGSTVGSPAGGPCIASATTACQTRLVGAIFTVGGKAGLAWNNFMFYGTGGFARGRIETRLNNVGGPFDQTVHSHNGWYAGGGIDYMVWQSAGTAILLGVEYQHVDLRTENHRSVLDGFGACPPGINCRDVSATVDTVRARLTVKYGPDPLGLLGGF